MIVPRPHQSTNLPRISPNEKVPFLDPFSNMVLFFPIIAAIPTVIGVSEGIAHQRSENNASATTEAEKEQMRKFTLECYCEGKGKRAREVHGGKVVLRKGKVGFSTFLLFLIGC